MKVKIFGAKTLRGVEDAVNTWLAHHGRLKISHILQSESSDSKDGWSLTITIFYS